MDTHFAKLFTYPTGQLLVQWENSEDPDDAETPYQVVCKTKHPSGVTANIANGYADEAKRDADFAAFDEEKALNYFTSQQSILTKMTA